MLASTKGAFRHRREIVRLDIEKQNTSSGSTLYQVRANRAECIVSGLDHSDERKPAHIVEAERRHCEGRHRSTCHGGNLRKQAGHGGSPKGACRMTDHMQGARSTNPHDIRQQPHHNRPSSGGCSQIRWDGRTRRAQLPKRLPVINLQAMPIH